LVEDEFIEPNDFRDPGGRKLSKSNDVLKTTNSKDSSSKNKKFKGKKSRSPPETQQLNIKKQTSSPAKASSKERSSSNKPPLSPNRLLGTNKSHLSRD